VAAPIRLTASHNGGLAISYQPLRMETRVCLSYLSTCSDMLLLVCVTHTSQQSFDLSDQGLPLMRRSFDTRVSIRIGNGLSVGLIQALATLVLVSTFIYLEKAAKLASLPRSTGICDCLVRRDPLLSRLSGAYQGSVSVSYPRFQRDKRIASTRPDSFLFHCRCYPRPATFETLQRGLLLILVLLASVAQPK
jgi:hypothetical protein